MHRAQKSHKAVKLKKGIRPRGSLQITSNTMLRIQTLPARFPPKTRYKRGTRRVTSVQQDALRECNNTRYERAIDVSRARNTTHYMRVIDMLLCATTHYGVCESGVLHDTGELLGSLHDTKELPDSLHDTGELTRARQDTHFQWL
jgi:hypothetical protein